MNITSFLQNRQLTVALTGDIDHHRAKEIIRVVEDKIDQYLPLVCILDFSEVTFMDSSGIAVVICALRKERELDGRLLLANLPPQPLRVLKAAGIEKIAEIREESRL
ncbi:MAG: STAS domain-containing protein [Clostridia bacterium]|nr:STAS domain-containing protein [Clostridia bacterium]